MLPSYKTAQLSANVTKLCKKLVPDTEPIFLTVEAKDFAEPNECYHNVELMIKKEGGSIQYGWQIWDTLPGIMIEAEFHAVWIDPQKQFHDITPKKSGITKILFLPDNKRKYEQQQIDNVRLNLTNDTLIDEYIKNIESIFKAKNRGELATSNFFVLTPEIRLLELKKLSYEEYIERKYYPQSDNPRNKTCSCGSGKKYKKCCGKT